MIANFHTVDGGGNRGIPSATAVNFRQSCLRNVLTACAATPEVQQGVPWVAMGDCNMVHEQVEIVASSLQPAPSFVCTFARRRDFIISSATLGQRKEDAFLSWDSDHWCLSAPVYHSDAVPQRQHGQMDDSEQSAQESQRPQDEVTSLAAKAIQIQAEQEAARHLQEQHQITEDAFAKREEADRLEELQQLAAAEQQSAHASSSQQVCVDPFVECGLLVACIQFQSQQEQFYMSALHFNFDSKVISDSISFTLR